MIYIIDLALEGLYIVGHILFYSRELGNFGQIERRLGKLLVHGKEIVARILNSFLRIYWNDFKDFSMSFLKIKVGNVLEAKLGIKALSKKEYTRVFFLFLDFGTRKVKSLFLFGLNKKVQKILQ